jgi:hypothetical protein
MKDRFEGKVVIVTGAASGIGEATARRKSPRLASTPVWSKPSSAFNKPRQNR